MNLIELNRYQSTDMAPIGVIGGILSSKISQPLYSKVLSDRNPNEHRSVRHYFPIPEFGLGEKDEMEYELTEQILDTYDKTEQRLVLFGHSLGGLFATKIGHKHPEAIRAVVCLTGAQEGISEETFAVKTLKTVIESFHGTLTEYQHIFQDSDYIAEHIRAVSTKWSPHVSLDLIASSRDSLIPAPQGLGLNLPSDQEKPSTYVLGKTTEQARKIPGVPEQTIGMPAEGPYGVLSIGHVGSLRNSKVLDLVRERRMATVPERVPPKRAPLVEALQMAA